jgi:LysM domain-containing protein
VEGPATSTQLRWRPRRRQLVSGKMSLDSHKMPRDIETDRENPTGTTASCYEWHVVQSGDTCYLLEQSYGITFAQCQEWNPSVNDSCGNLDLSEAYCVKGPST